MNLKTQSILLGIAWFALSTHPNLFAEPLETLLPETLENAAGETISRDDLKGKVVALYFSAHRCAPCRTFTPKLVAFYEANKNKNFELIFVSFDDRAEEKREYIAENKMTWLTLPGNKSADHFKLANQYGVSKLPRLIVFDSNGRIITGQGREDVTNNPSEALDKWNKS